MRTGLHANSFSFFCCNVCFLKQYKYILDSTSARPGKWSLKLHLSFRYAKAGWAMLRNFHLSCFIGKTETEGSDWHFDGWGRGENVKRSYGISEKGGCRNGVGYWNTWCNKVRQGDAVKLPPPPVAFCGEIGGCISDKVIEICLRGHGQMNEHRFLPRWVADMSLQVMVQRWWKT